MIDLALVNVEPTPAAFVQAIKKAMKGSGGKLAVLPQGDFAEEVLSQSAGFEHTTPEQADILCLTHREQAPLEQALHTQLHRTAGTIIIPRLAGHGLDRALFLISIPKAGTHLLYRLAEALSFKTGVVCPDIPTPGYWYCLEYSNSHTVPRDFFVDSVRRASFGNRMHPFPFTPSLFIVRHPWDVLVSEANYYVKPGNTVFSGFYAGLDFDARTKRLLEDGALLGRFCDRVLAFEPWLHFDNVIPLAFEDLVGELGGGTLERQKRLIWSIQLKLGVPGNPRDIGVKLFDKNSPTFNEGRIGTHRTVLPDELKEWLNSCNADVLQAFGYQSTDSPYTAYAETWRTRGLQCAVNRLDATPVAVEMNFWGHNLVRYRSRFYAVPIALGPLDLPTDERLAGFLKADNLSALRDTVISQSLTGELRTRVKTLEDAMKERDGRLIALEKAAEESHAQSQAKSGFARWRRR